MEPQRKHTIADLNGIYQDGDTVDKDVFAEMRSNCLLDSGDHYTKKGSRFWERIKDQKELSSEQKLRLTKNHVQKIHKGYINNLVAAAPTVKILPKNQSETHDRKVAMLHDMVVQDAKQKYKLEDRIDEWATDFVKLGECGVKVYYDPDKGQFKGYEPQVDEMGQILVDPQTGQPMDDEEKPVFTGAFVFERIYGFNLLRAKDAKTLDESRVLMIRKMVDVKDMKKKFKEGDPRLKMVHESMDETFLVFDGATGNYGKSSGDQMMLREFYFRPCAQYPKGYFFITVKEGILFEGELPFGIFPIRTRTFDEIATTPRGRAITRVARPYQAEINRSASKIAEHQITLGDDKIIMQSGAKMSQGTVLPGVRGITISGPAPTILNGRDGSQYVEYMNSQITEMYAACNYYEDQEEKTPQVDPWSMVFRNMRNRKKFSRYARKFEAFVTDVYELYLELARNYLSDEELAEIFGPRDAVNIPEFRKPGPLCYQIKVMPTSDDVETMMGKQLTFNHVLQYAGNALKPEDIGKLVRNMPFANDEEVLSDLTMDYDIGENIILALDRGELPDVNRYDNHEYMVKRLIKRMREPDFEHLPPNVQQNYDIQVQTHEKMLTAIAQELQMAEQGFIPTGGYLVACDFYAPDPADPAKTRRVRIPYQSLQWLLDKLEKQGATQASFESLPPGAQADTAAMLTRGNTNPSDGGQGQASVA